MSTVQKPMASRGKDHLAVAVAGAGAAADIPDISAAAAAAAVAPTPRAATKISKLKCCISIMLAVSAVAVIAVIRQGFMLLNSMGEQQALNGVPMEVVQTEATKRPGTIRGIDEVRIAAGVTDETRAMRDSLRETVSSVDLVVNCCNESPAWMEQWTKYVPVHNIYIYNKCRRDQGKHLGAGKRNLKNATTAELNPPTDSHWLNSISGKAYIIDLPNVGREGQAWLTHMLQHPQDSSVFSDYTVFLQCSHECSLQDIQVGLLNATGCDFLDLHQYRFGERQAMNPQRGDRNFMWHYGTTLLGKGKDDYKWLLDHVCDLHNTYRKNESVPCEDAVVTLRGEFIVKKQLILDNRNNDKLHKLLSKVSQGNDPPEGHFLERGWVEVLGARQRMCDLLPWELRVPPHRRPRSMRKKKSP